VTDDEASPRDEADATRPALAAGTEPEVLGGETAGEVDADPTNPFFVSKRAAAVFKHAVLDQYLVPFASKIGKYAPGGRVVYIDGYAGPGRYKDNTKGSPALVLEHAESMADYRTLECLFVERSRADFRRLKGLVTEAQQRGITCDAYPGSVSRRLDDLLTRAGGAPLFVFLDPFGLGLPFTELTAKVLGGARGPQGAKTEVLINFSANATRRIGGFLDPKCAAKNRNSTLEAMDRVCGDDWWREVYRAHDSNEARVEAIANEYARRVARTVKAGFRTSSVRNRSALQPVYHLVFLSRHPDGLWLFGDALARAQQKWRRVLDPPPAHVEGTLFDLPDNFEQEEARRSEEWKGEIKRNIVRLLEYTGEFDIRDRYGEVFGSALGLAPYPLLRKAVKELYQEGRTSCSGIGDPSRFRLTRPQAT
jgi:three-Cys-motif partner protein